MMWHVELETAEIKAFDALYRCAPPQLGSALRLAVTHVGPVTAFAAGALGERMFNRAVWLSPAKVDEVAPALLDFYRSQGAARFWLQPAEPVLDPYSLQQIVAAGGVADSIRWAKFSCAVAPPLPPAATELVRVGPAEAPDVARTIASAFGMPDIFQPWLEAFVLAPHVHTYLARVNGEPAAAGLYHEADDVAWLGLGGTLPAYRRRGLQQALLARRIHDALASGNRWVVAETGVLPDRDNPSLRNLERSGLCLRYLRPNYQFSL